MSFLLPHIYWFIYINNTIFNRFYLVKNCNNCDFFTIGNSTTPIYIDSDGKAKSCSDVFLKVKDSISYDKSKFNTYISLDLNYPFFINVHAILNNAQSYYTYIFFTISYDGAEGSTAQTVYKKVDIPTDDTECYCKILVINSYESLDVRYGKFRVTSSNTIDKFNTLDFTIEYIN